MKDGLNATSITRLAGNLQRSCPGFETPRFVREACTGLERLELKERVAHVAGAMVRHLPADPRESIRGILDAIPDWDRGEANDSLRGFASWPVFVFVETAGADLGEFAIRALGELSHLFTAEFSIRPFVEKNPEAAMKVVLEWTQHSSDQVRRLASEGIRPRLPWAGKLPAFVEDLDEDKKKFQAMLDRNEETACRRASSARASSARASSSSSSVSTQAGSAAQASSRSTTAGVTSPSSASFSIGQV
ncbi:MAG: hypothetical protein GY811_18060 [Myxococcales bacterium]|nr:hypothetical protein [Myxococcales bacterium]